MSTDAATPPAETPCDITGPGLGDTVRKGAGWTVAARFSGRVVRILVFLVLAKRLGPTAFGAVALIYVIDEIGMIVARLGFSNAIIQRKEAAAEHFDSAMFINVCSATVFGACVAVLAALIGRYFHNDLVADVLVPYAAVFVVRSFSYTPEALIRREMRFRTFVLLGEGANVVSCVLMVLLVLAGVGVWSVMYAELLRAFLLSTSYVAFAGHRFRPRFHWHAVREMVPFSGWSTVNAIFYYGLGNIDYIVVGRVLGTTALGWYMFAFRLISQPVEQIAMRLHEVMFPAFSRFQHKPEEVLRVYRKLVCLVSLFALPFLGIAVVLAAEFFGAIMGPQWRPAILPFQIMCLAGMMRAFVGSSSAVIKSKGHVRFEGITLAVLFGLMWVGVLIGCAWGLPGVAVVVDVVMVACLATYLIYQGHKTGVGVRVFLDSVMPSLLGAGVAALTAVCVNWALLAAGGTGDLGRLLISGTCASVAFVGVILLHRNPLLRSVLWELKTLFQRVHP